jgi:signal transduction histidine kinase
MTLHRRWMLALAAFTFAVTALFGLFAMAFVYTVEDRFLDRLLKQEAQAQRAHRAVHGRWGPTGAEFLVLHEKAATLPPEVAQVLALEPHRREIPGDDGRHYHLLPLEASGRAPWLVAEVSQQLIVRPIRGELLAWLTGWGLFVVGLSLGLGWVLARRVSAPLETLAGRVAQAVPAQLPRAVSPEAGADEVGAVAQAFDALMARTHDFIAREQAFTRDASHELRTPLAVLQLGIERLRADPSVPSSARATLTTLHASTQWMQQTVETLLALARESEHADTSNEPVALLPLLEQWVLAHADWLDQQPLALDIQLDRQARMRLPAQALRLAIASLLGNALAHGEAGGTVTVRFDGQALVVQNPHRRTDGQTEADAPRSGHGFGLAILQRLLDAAGGQLEFEQDDRSTTARVQVRS